ncbi:MAG: hypothetical protein AUJ41_03170 [Candidatus Pacebacteria bacterium CG1_02_43_31]|nr:MAG: hypothetical protein AUJ41_03170 [Candidatus Pacebacteria bacterium CG1_02_43_31]
MDKIPKRTGIAYIYRSVLHNWEKYLIFPSKNPSNYQIVGLLLSIGYLLTNNLIFQIILVGVILILDWMDGAVARKFNLDTKEGWMIDVFIDRLSEGFMFAAHLSTTLGTWFFALYIINTILSIYSIKSGKHLIMPLRFVWLLILLGKLWIS